VESEAETMKNVLRVNITFFQQLPDFIYKKLDISEFYFPLGEIEKARSKLEKTIGQYIMTYKRSIFNKHILLNAHLCANIKGAILTSEQLMLVNKYEEAFRRQGVSFVAYAKPLVFINPKESVIGKYYKKIGLIS